MRHIPVLLKESIDLLDPKEGEAIIDGTAGSGGHSKEILKRIGKSGKLLLIDWDPENARFLEKEFKDFSNVTAEQGNYAELPEIMAKNNFPKADGLLLDLGFSSGQLEKTRLRTATDGQGGKGFSFQSEEPLIMTYSDEQESLSEFLKKATLQELTDIIWKFGEEKYAWKIAEAIFLNRRNLKTAKDLAETIKGAAPKNYEHGRIHPATRTFQALRIYLNKELDNLEILLKSLPEILKIGSRIAIISFHSLEDRIVKNYFNDLKNKGRIAILTKKPIVPTKEEIADNPRSRSAKLRAAVII